MTPLRALCASTLGGLFWACQLSSDATDTDSAAGSPAAISRTVDVQTSSPLAAENSPQRASSQRGVPNTEQPLIAAKLPLVASNKTFRNFPLPLPQLAELLAQHPETRHLSADLSYFSQSAAVSAVTANGKRKSRGFLFTARPLLWSPEPRTQFLIVTARSGRNTSFVVAFHLSADNSYRLTASFVMKREPGPVLLAYNGYIKPRMHFSTCWGCLGETGKLLYRQNNSVAILQQ